MPFLSRRSCRLELDKLLAIAMMNADQKRASFSATPVFAELRQVTNETEEAHQYSILVDDIQQGRCFLLSSYDAASVTTSSSGRPACALSRFLCSISIL